ncbi:MAG: hypothetical protein ACO394_11075 [Blastocatellia bacterium]
MSCRECQEAILEGQKSLQERMEVASGEAVAAHLLVCFPCRLFAKRQRQLQEGLALLAAADASLEAPREVEVRLQAMLGRPTRSRPLSIDGRWRSPALAVGALAASLLLVSWLGIRWFRPSPAPPAAPGALARRTPPATFSREEGRPPALPDQADGPARPQSTLWPAAKLPQRRPARSTAPRAPLPMEELSKGVDGDIDEAEEADEELVTDFFPLYAGQQLVPLERGRLIRTLVPRSLLGTLGLPVHPDWAIFPIKADVVVGEDGTARAVRFVREEP